jgi:hypothetical protein
MTSSTENVNNIFSKRIYRKQLISLSVRVYARCFITSETTEAYTNMFSKLFGLIKSTVENHGHDKLVWKHIHGYGIQYVTVDMDSK